MKQWNTIFFVLSSVFFSSLKGMELPDASQHDPTKEKGYSVYADRLHKEFPELTEYIFSLIPYLSVSPESLKVLTIYTLSQKEVNELLIGCLIPEQEMGKQTVYTQNQQQININLISRIPTDRIKLELYKRNYSMINKRAKDVLLAIPQQEINAILLNQTPRNDVQFFLKNITPYKRAIGALQTIQMLNQDSRQRFTPIKYVKGPLLFINSQFIINNISNIFKHKNGKLLKQEMLKTLQQAAFYCLFNHQRVEHTPSTNSAESGEQQIFITYKKILTNYHAYQQKNDIDWQEKLNECTTLKKVVHTYVNNQIASQISTHFLQWAEETEYMFKALLKKTAYNPELRLLLSTMDYEKGEGFETIFSIPNLSSPKHYIAAQCKNNGLFNYMTKTKAALLPTGQS